jgi:hypothetical protein
MYTTQMIVQQVHNTNDSTTGTRCAIICVVYLLYYHLCCVPVVLSCVLCACCTIICVVYMLYYHVCCVPVVLSFVLCTCCTIICVVYLLYYHLCCVHVVLSFVLCSFLCYYLLVVLDFVPVKQENYTL